MAANTSLASVNSFPRSQRITSIGTTFQEVVLPSNGTCRRISLRPSAEARVAFTGDTDATDGGTPSQYQTIDASTWTSWTLSNRTGGGSIFIAAATGTITCEVSVESD